MQSSLYRQSESGKPPLRIGLLLDSAELPSCFAEVIDQILDSNFARLELLVFNGEMERKSEPPPVRSLVGKSIDALSDRNRRRTLLFAFYQRWDNRHIDHSKNPLALIDCSTRFTDVESISVTPIRKRFVHRFPPEAIERIREKHLDVLIRFGFNILRGDILRASKYGVWSYHHGDGDYYRGGPAHFWEVYEQNPISGVMLQVLTEELDAGKVLCKGLFATHSGISQALNRVQPYWGATTFVNQKLQELHQRGWDHVERAALPPSPYQGRKKIYTAPSNVEMACWLGPLLIRKSLQRLVRRPMVKHWRLAIRSETSINPGSQSEPDLSGFRWIDPPKNCFYADPFMIEEGGKTWVFFEDFDYATNRGRISCAPVEKGGIGTAKAVLEKPYHLSYPCVFRDAGAIYMIPESGANETVELYRCVRFPDKWELEKELFHGKTVDTTVWFDGSLYWFFTSLLEPRGFGTQLWLFHATSLTGEWTPHPANPISTDVRNSRGAGAILQENGKLFRPSQDCSKHYGYSMTFNEITALDLDRYEEKPGTKIDPRWAPGLLATHTYSRAGRVEIIDGCVSFPTSAVS